MSEHKHTHGKLMVEPEWNGWDILDESGTKCIAKVWSCIDPDPTGRANADLYAASPAMLDVLEQGYISSTLSQTLRALATDIEHQTEATTMFSSWLRSKADQIDKVVRAATGGGA